MERSAPTTPVDILFNCRGKPVSVELDTGETINGTVMRTDRTMNVVLKQCIRTSADGRSFYRARECLVRAASIRQLRLSPEALKPNRGGGFGAARRKQGATGRTQGKKQRGGKREAKGAAK